MSILNTIYNSSPIFVQNIFCSIKGYFIQKKRYNSNFHLQLQKFENREYEQITCLKQFLLNCKEVPYYQTVFNKYKLDVNAENPYIELKKLPILTKETVKENITNITNPYFKGKIYKAKTSGTTGSGLVFSYSTDMENKQWAVWWRYRRWHGIDLNMWCGWFGGRTIISIKQQNPPYWRINKQGKQVMFSAYHLNIDTVEYYYKEIIKRNLTWLHGYPSQLSLLASLIQDKGFDLLLSIKYITFGAENLLLNQREIIQKAFPNATLRQHYGLSEGVANISEDINGDLIVDDDFCYVEFIPVENTSPNICRIIGTGFFNEAFPLIRYDTGDIAEIEYLPDGKLKILSIDGRKEDFITLPNGVKLGRLDHIFKSLTTIREAQIHQKDLYHIDFKIVKGHGYTINDEHKLWKEIRERINETVSVNINYVDKVERTKSGKLRFVISDIK
ncbi:capsular polysaccharide biosynthesis protein CapK [Bacteroidia bacterium]|nr:capsular polysaccharide biosynthesis protein CapK [Bacteroidia bacterium]